MKVIPAVKYPGLMWLRYTSESVVQSKRKL